MLRAAIPMRLRTEPPRNIQTDQYPEKVKKHPQKAFAKKRYYRLFIFNNYIYNKKSDGLNMRRTLLSGPKSHNIRTHFTKEDFKC